MTTNSDGAKGKKSDLISLGNPVHLQTRQPASPAKPFFHHVKDPGTRSSRPGTRLTVHSHPLANLLPLREYHRIPQIPTP
jgi:hypothetical protein